MWHGRLGSKPDLLLKLSAASLIPIRVSQDEVAVAKGIGEEGGNTPNRGWILIAAK